MPNIPYSFADDFRFTMDDWTSASQSLIVAMFLILFLFSYQIRIKTFRATKTHGNHNIFE